MKIISREGIVRMKREYAPDSAALTELGGRIKLVCDTAIALHDKVERLEKAIALIKAFFLLMNNDAPTEDIRQVAIKCNEALAELEGK